MGSSLEVEGLGSSVFGNKLGAKLVSGKEVLLNSITYIGEVPINTRSLSVMYFSRSFRQFKCFVFSTCIWECSKTKENKQRKAN